MTDTPWGDEVEASIARVQRRISGYGASQALVAFSGGVDSALVLALAARTLGAATVTAVTAVSPSYPAGEMKQARGVARGLGVRFERIETREVEKEAYARNDASRCLHCKIELYAAMQGLTSAGAAQNTVLLAGANADDRQEFRPGLLAAERYGIRNPLLEERIDKSSVRGMARRLELPVAEKPALACLASRVAYGIRVTPDVLARIDRAEQAVRALGFSSVRVRHLGSSAAIEVPLSEVSRLTADPRLPQLVDTLRDLGWQEVTVDLQGLRSGSMNAALRISPALERALKRL